MAKSAGQKQKILYVKELLERRGDRQSPLSMEMILSYLENRGIYAERKSIYDDIDALRDFGMDIVYQKKHPRG